MVVGGHAGCLELHGFREPELPEGDANLHAQLGNFPHDVKHLLEFRVAAAYAAPGRPHAKTRRAVLPGRFGRGQYLIGLQQPLRLDSRLIMSALRAIAAVLAAAAGFDAQQRAKLHFTFPGPERFEDAPGLLDEIEKRPPIRRLELHEIHGWSLRSA